MIDPYSQFVSVVLAPGDGSGLLSPNNGCSSDASLIPWAAANSLSLWEVLEPPVLRLRLADYAEQIARRYAN